MSSAWQAHGKRMAIAWQAHGKRMAIAWQYANVLAIKPDPNRSCNWANHI
jgi:hypothetical protein